MNDVEYATMDSLQVRVDTHKNYSEHPDDVELAVMEMLDVPRASDLLDVGCGTGTFLTRLADAGFSGRLVGLDASDAAVAAVREAGVAEAFLGDAQDLPFGDGTFGAVTARHMLYHVPQPRVAVQEAHRVLRPGGSFLATVNHPNGLPRITELVRGVLADLGGEPSDLAGWLASDALPGLLEGVFDKVTTVPHDNALVFEDPAPLVAFGVAIMGIYGAPYGTDLRRPYIEEIARRVGAWFDAHDEPWRDRKGYVVCRAEKV